MAIPAARLLYEQGFEIEWVCGRAVRPLLECYSWINLIPADDKAILRGRPLEMFFALRPYGENLFSSDMTFVQRCTTIADTLS